MKKILHPREALFDAALCQAQQRWNPRSCEHFVGKEKYIEKAFSLKDSYGDIFDITCDLEDGAEEGQEKEHLSMILDVLRSNRHRERQIGVRLHHVDFPAWRNEVSEIVSELWPRLNYLCIPKLRNFREARSAIYFVQSEYRKFAANMEQLPIHVIIESPEALRDVWRISEIASVDTLDFGHMDYISSHHGAIPESAMRSPHQFEHPLLRRAKAELASAALAKGLVPSHNVTINLHPASEAGSDAKRAREEFGFQRMWSIHPQQIQPIVEAFRPEIEEVRRAESVLVTAQQAAWGPIAYEGRLYDRASYRLLWTILQRARSSGIALTPEAESAFFPVAGRSLG